MTGEQERIAPMSDDEIPFQGGGSERSLEIVSATARGNAAWQAWRRQLLEIKAGLTELKAESAAWGARAAAAAQANADRIRADIEAREEARALDAQAEAWRRRTPPERRLQ